MIFSTITQDMLQLTANTYTIPAQYSNNIQIQFEQDNTNFNGWIPTVQAGLYDSSVIECADALQGSAVPIDSSGIITLNNNILSQSGFLILSITLTSGDENVVLPAVVYQVTASTGQINILPPDTEAWQQVVQSFTESYLNNYTTNTVQPVLTQAQQAVQTANEASTNANQAVETANTASANVQTAYSNLGNYKVENGILYFMKADGTYNDTGVTLAGQSTVTDVNSNPILTAPLTAPPNSVINSDFLSWQRGTVFNYQTSSISANTYMPDCWYVGNSSKNFILSRTSIGAHVEIFDATAYFAITQLISGHKAGDVVTMVVGITNHGNQFSMQQRIGNSGSNNKSITIAPGNNVFTLTYTLQSSDFDSNSNFVIQPFFGYCGIDYANCTINYIRLYPGSIAYNGYREDYATALMRCQPYVNLITYELTNYAATNSFAIRQSINIPNMIAEPTVTVISEGTQTNIADISETFPYTNYSCLSVSINSTNAGQVRVYGRTILLSCEGQ